MSTDGVPADSRDSWRHRAIVIGRDVERNFEGYLATALLLIYAFLLSINVLRRMIYGNEFLWTQDIIIGMFIWMSWLATAYAIRTRDHLRFTMVTKRMSNRQRYVVSWVEWILWICVAGVIVWYSQGFLEPYLRSGATVTSTPVPEWLLRIAIPVGFGLMLVRVLQMMVIMTRKYRNGEEIEMGGQINE